MTVETIREMLKVHIKAAESIGKMEGALSLLGFLVAIDAEVAHQRAITAVKA